MKLVTEKTNFKVENSNLNVGKISTLKLKFKRKKLKERHLYASVAT